MTKLKLINGITFHPNFKEFVTYLILHSDHAEGRFNKSFSHFGYIELDNLLLNEVELQLFNDDCTFHLIWHLFSDFLLKRCSQDDRHRILQALNSDDYDSVSYLFKDYHAFDLPLKLAICDVFEDHKDDLLELFKSRLTRFIFLGNNLDSIQDDHLKSIFVESLPILCEKFLADCAPKSDDTLEKGIITLKVYMSPNDRNLYMFVNYVLTKYINDFYTLID